MATSTCKIARTLWYPFVCRYLWR